MKVRCPNCRAVSVVDEAAIPPQGAYGRCPKCHTRILLRRGADTSLSPLGTRTRIMEDEAADETTRIVPESGLGLGCVAKALALAIFAAMVVFAAFVIPPIQHPPVPEKAASKPIRLDLPPEYPPAAFNQDLLTLRRKIRHRNYSAYQTFDDLEIRVFIEMMIRCGLDCYDVDRLIVTPLSTRDGFKAELYCYGGGRHSIEYLWSRNWLAIDGRVCP